MSNVTQSVLPNIPLLRVSQVVTKVSCLNPFQNTPSDRSHALLVSNTSFVALTVPFPINSIGLVKTHLALRKLVRGRMSCCNSFRQIFKIKIPRHIFRLNRIDRIYAAET